MARPAQWHLTALCRVAELAARAAKRKRVWHRVHAWRRLCGVAPIDAVSSYRCAQALTDQLVARLQSAGIPTHSPKGHLRSLPIFPLAVLQERREVVRAVASLAQEMPERAQYWRMLTITSGTRCVVTKTRQRIDQLRKNISRWATNARLTHHVDLLLLRIELTRNDDSTWHVHAHLMIDRHIAIDREVIRSERIQHSDEQWNNALASLRAAIGSHHISDDGRIGHRRSSGQLGAFDFGSLFSTATDAAAVASYLAKADDLLNATDAELRELTRQLERVRTLELCGQLRTWRQLCQRHKIRWIAAGRVLHPVAIRSIPQETDNSEDCGIFAMHDYVRDATGSFNAEFRLRGKHAQQVLASGPWTDRQRAVLAGAERWKLATQRRLDDGSLRRALAAALGGGQAGDAAVPSTSRVA